MGEHDNDYFAFLGGLISILQLIISAVVYFLATGQYDEHEEDNNDDTPNPAAAA